MYKTLQKDWGDVFGVLLHKTRSELVISSPYVSDKGIDFLLNNLSQDFKKLGKVSFLTNLSPRCICQGSTDPNALKRLAEKTKTLKLYHLPKLHSKIYLRDEGEAIITSGNLTGGGLYYNFEYGISLNDTKIVSIIKKDILSYSELGAKIDYQDLVTYCKASKEVKDIYVRKEKSLTKKFREALQKANDTLIRASLAEGALHNVFEKTIKYLLKKNGPLTTHRLHNLIEEIHPDLCNNTIDRVIDGKSFGKKWKHAVRTAEQHLKRKDLIELVNGNWKLIKLT